jgi:L-threonylcarbamoyladenylate synthase
MGQIEDAVRILKHDGLVVFPTDTVYGLGADAFSEEAILKVFVAKNRPLSNPISIAVSSRDMLDGVARVEKAAELFIERFLPGPVTAVLPAKKTISEILTGGTGMIGIRFPGHPVALELISTLDSPITATSANRTGEKDPVTVDECRIPYDFLIDAGRLPGNPSTVVDVASHRIIRPGAQVEEIIAFFSSLE